MTVCYKNQQNQKKNKNKNFGKIITKQDKFRNRKLNQKNLSNIDIRTFILLLSIWVTTEGDVSTYNARK